MAVNAVMPALANPAVYLSEEDPEVVRDALPFLLKTIESILDTDPERQDALLFANTGFLLYASAFLQADAEIAEWDDYELAAELNGRAQRMFLRARDYGLRNVELDHPGIAARLRDDARDSSGGLRRGRRREPVLSRRRLAAGHLARARPAGAGRRPAGGARAARPRVGRSTRTTSGARCTAAFVTLESVGEAMGGSNARAREHFARAVELSDGLDAGPYLALATGVAIAEENREEFRELLETAIAIDPDEEPSNRLLNLIAQKRARVLLDHIDDLFFEPLAALDDDPENRP